MYTDLLLHDSAAPCLKASSVWRLEPDMSTGLSDTLPCRQTRRGTPTAADVKTPCLTSSPHLWTPLVFFSRRFENLLYSVTLMLRQNTYFEQPAVLEDGQWSTITVLRFMQFSVKLPP